METPRSKSITIRLSVMMFLQFFIWGAYLVPMAKYIIHGGLADKLGTGQLDGFIGNAYATNSIAAIVAPFLVGLIADRFFSGQRVLGILHLLGAALLYMAGTTKNPGGLLSGGFLTYMLAYSICYMPTLALVNSVSFDQLDQPDKQFPAIRVWGTIGWIIAGVFVGIIIPKIMPQASTITVKGEQIVDAGMTSIPFLMAAAASVILGIYCFTLPDSPPKARGEKVSLKRLIGLDALGLFKNPAFAVFALSSFMLCIPLAVYYARANDFLASTGIHNSEAIMSLGQGSEIIFMLLLPFFLARFGVKTMLLGGMAAWIARYFLFSYGAGSNAMLIAAVILHGICYDFFFVTGQLYTDKKAPLEIRASAQGIIALLTYGVGMFVGAKFWPIVATRLTKDAAEGTAFPWQPFWSTFAWLALGIALFFAITFWDKTKVGDQNSQ